MKNILVSLTLTALFFASCKDGKKGAENEFSTDSNTEVAESTESENYNSEEADSTNMLSEYDNNTQDWRSSRNYSKDEANRMADDITYNVRVADGSISEIRGYSDYSDMRNYLDIFANSTPETEMQSEFTLRESFDVFKNTIPYYLRRDDVNEAIKDVEKELTDYEENKAKENPSPTEHDQNVREIQEAFDNLEKEIIKARKRFENNRKDAMEEFMEEIKDKSNKTQSERYRDAMEEYNEEMND